MFPVRSDNVISNDLFHFLLDDRRMITASQLVFRGEIPLEVKSPTLDFRSGESVVRPISALVAPPPHEVNSCAREIHLTAFDQAHPLCNASEELLHIRSWRRTRWEEGHI